MSPQEAEILYRQNNPPSPEELAARKEAARKAKAEAKEREKRMCTCIESGCNNRTPPPPRQNYHTMSMEFRMMSDPYHHRCRPCYAKWLCRNTHLEIEHAGGKRERNRQIVQQITNGVSRADVAKALGTTKAYMSRICVRADTGAKDLRRQERSARSTEIVERVQTGETTAAVAKDFKLSRGHVGKICKEAGVIPKERQALRYQEVQKRNRQIVERVHAGKIFKTLAKEFGLAWETVQRICQRAGRSVADRSPETEPTTPAYLQRCIQKGADPQPRGNEALRRELYLHRDGLCGICGQLMALEGTHIDHIMPRTKGGTNDW